MQGGKKSKILYSNNKNNYLKTFLREGGGVISFQKLQYIFFVGKEIVWFYKKFKKKLENNKYCTN